MRIPVIVRIVEKPVSCFWIGVGAGPFPGRLDVWSAETTIVGWKSFVYRLEGFQHFQIFNLDSSFRRDRCFQGVRACGETLY
jgi:hypothetical protein